MAGSPFSRSELGDDEAERAVASAALTPGIGGVEPVPGDGAAPEQLGADPEVVGGALHTKPIRRSTVPPSQAGSVELYVSSPFWQLSSAVAPATWLIATIPRLLSARYCAGARYVVEARSYGELVAADRTRLL